MKKIFHLLATSLFAATMLISCKQEIELPHIHTFSTEWTSDADYHWHTATCEHSSEVDGKEVHTWDKGKETKAPTEEAKGEKTYTCTVCAKTKVEVVAKLAHTHKAEEAWASDKTQHWHKCSGCEEKIDLENHTFDDGVVTTAATTTEEGVKTLTCTICNYAREEAIEKLPEEIKKDTKDDKTSSEENKTSNDDLIDPKPETTVKTYPDDTNPTAGANACLSQDFIFNINSVGTTTITIRRSEWNKMLEYYDYFYKNENSVIAESYKYEKDGEEWELKTVGLRLRGNTSRFRPQGKDSPTDETGHTMPNASWSSGYYSYAATCPDNDYRQSHFKVDFEPLDDDDRKMSDCMKGVALKRSDSVFSREIFCYNLFHQYGIWTAPRASQTKVYIDIIEDVDADGIIKETLTDCETTNLDFGVYEMFEEVNKQSLKGRTKKNNNSSSTWNTDYSSLAWTNNEGDLWKCSGGDLTTESNTSERFGTEQVEILNTDKDKSEWSHIWTNGSCGHNTSTKNICYDLKTNKKNLDKATTYFQNFITELNELSNYSKSTEEGITKRKEFYEKWFDVDFFIRTYAVNILCGMDDDYWGNANNYYLYFDNGKNGSKKCYFIPFDYDNTLGCSISGDKTQTNPFEWGDGHNRPLLDRLIEVPEYAEKFKNALLEVSSQDEDSPWNKTNCIDRWTQLLNQVENLVYSSDIANHQIGSVSVNYDEHGWKETPHYLLKDYNNIYEQVSNNLEDWLSNTGKSIIFDLNGGNINGATENVSVTYTGATKKFTKMLETPTKTDCTFVGWTKTKNGSDYAEEYNREDELTLYASWIDVSGAEGLTIYEIPDSSHEGIRIFVFNEPENHYRRTWYINGKEAGGENKDDGSKYSPTWIYPYTESGNEYTVKVKYQDKGYADLGESEPITITANSGMGDIKVINEPEYTIEENKLKWSVEPVIKLGDIYTTSITSDNWDSYYVVELASTSRKDEVTTRYEGTWNYMTWNWSGHSTNNFNLKDKLMSSDADKQTRNEDILNGNLYDFTFKITYHYNSSSTGNYTYVLYNWSEKPSFNIIPQQDQ